MPQQRCSARAQRPMLLEPGYARKALRAIMMRAANTISTLPRGWGHDSRRPLAVTQGAIASGGARASGRQVRAWLALQSPKFAANQARDGLRHHAQIAPEETR